MSELFKYDEDQLLSTLELIKQQRKKAFDQMQTLKNAIRPLEEGSDRWEGKQGEAFIANKNDFMKLAEKVSDSLDSLEKRTQKAVSLTSELIARIKSNT